MNFPNKNQIYLQDEGNNSSCHRRRSWSARVRRGAPRFLFLTRYWGYLSNVGEISVRYWCESSEMLVISWFWINHPFRFVVIKFKYKYSSSTNTTSMTIQNQPSIQVCCHQVQVQIQHQWLFKSTFRAGLLWSPSSHRPWKNFVIERMKRKIKGI